jgi:organic hydroperoxide reductase OsmC/OhrA
MATTHRFRTELAWSGTTAGGYRDYPRTHRVTLPTAPAEPAEPASPHFELPVSADVAFRGDPTLPNPEQLLLAAASSCQLLSFLAVAARAGVEVLEYADEAEAEMPVTREPMRITRIVLRPRVVVAAGTDVDVVVPMLHQAHDECFIANSLTSQVVLEPTVVVVGTHSTDRS